MPPVGRGGGVDGEDAVALRRDQGAQAEGGGQGEPQPQRQPDGPDVARYAGRPISAMSHGPCPSLGNDGSVGVPVARRTAATSRLSVRMYRTSTGEAGACQVARWVAEQVGGGGC
jgi:hypothetical protein